MAPLITVANLILHIETDLATAEVQRLIDAADDSIVEAHGEHSSTGTVTDLLIGGDRALFLTRPYSALTSVTEYAGTSTTVLVAADYRAWYGNRLLERLALDATNPAAYWAERVQIIFTPVDDDKQRIEATIDLVRLAMQVTGLQSQRAGDYSAVSLNYHKERAAIINRLGRKSMIPG